MEKKIRRQSGERYLAVDPAEAAETVMVAAAVVAALVAALVVGVVVVLVAAAAALAAAEAKPQTPTTAHRTMVAIPAAEGRSLIQSQAQK